MSEKTYRIDFSKEKLTGYTILVNVLAVLLAVFFLLVFVLGISRVDGTSMSPTLSDHQIVLYSKLSTSPMRGDIAAIVTPAGSHYIKRVIALPGDTVDIHDGRVYVNGEEENSPYAVGSTGPETITFQSLFTHHECRFPSKFSSCIIYLKEFRNHESIFPMSGYTIITIINKTFACCKHIYPYQTDRRECNRVGD